jgi:hypothetical protein
MPNIAAQSPGRKGSRRLNDESPGWPLLAGRLERLDGLAQRSLTLLGSGRTEAAARLLAALVPELTEVARVARPREGLDGLRGRR